MIQSPTNGSALTNCDTTAATTEHGSRVTTSTLHQVNTSSSVNDSINDDRRWLGRAYRKQHSTWDNIRSKLQFRLSPTSLSTWLWTLSYWLNVFRLPSHHSPQNICILISIQFKCIFTQVRMQPFSVLSSRLSTAMLMTLTYNFLLVISSNCDPYCIISSVWWRKAEHPHLVPPCPHLVH